MFSSGGGLPVTVTWYFIQSPFFTPTMGLAKATAVNETVMISTVRVIASHLDLCM
jgi:hypothetical protein